MKQKKITEENAIYILVCSWSDRHGDRDVDPPNAFTSPEKAHKVIVKRALKYIQQHKGVKKNGEFNTDNVASVMLGEKFLTKKSELMDLSAEANDIDVDVDEDGTWARWQLYKTYVE